MVEMQSAERVVPLFEPGTPEHERTAEPFEVGLPSENEGAEAVEARRDAVRSQRFLAEYLETLGLFERLHRLMLDVVKDEFERLGRGDINSVQALLLFHIGEEELTAGDLKARGYYQGSNVSYNLKKLVESGYLHHERCSMDRRSVRIRATEKGIAVSRIVADLFARHSTDLLDERIVERSEAVAMNDAMQRLERFWRGRIRYIY